MQEDSLLKINTRLQGLHLEMCCLIRLEITGLDLMTSGRSVKWKLLSCVWLFATPWPWNSPGRNIGVGSRSLLQGIFPTQGSNPGLPHCRWTLHQLSHKGSPRILEWVAYPFSSRSSQPRNWNRVSCIVGRFFSNWAIREIPRSINLFVFQG